MVIPRKLFRFRPLPLDDIRVDREIEMLRDSYLYASPFYKMNDPMEAFYETGSPSDWIMDTVLAPSGKKCSDMYAKLGEMIDNSALVSFSSTNEDLPMWAYYASNFMGMCLEFDTEALFIGDFQNEKLRKVTYAKNALRPISLDEIIGDNSLDIVIDRLTRKRIEWSHEKEWRFITGKTGPKYYLDDALCRVFLGPRINKDHAGRICDALKRRSVEVLQGEVRGFNLTFRTIKEPVSLDMCESVGARHFTQDDYQYAEDKLREFLAVPFDKLIERCRRIALRPNMEKFAGIDRAGNGRDAIYIWTAYKLRSGREVYHKQYFDQQLQPIL